MKEASLSKMEAVASQVLNPSVGDDAPALGAKRTPLARALRVNAWWLWIGFLTYLALGRVEHPEFLSRAQLTLLFAPLVTIPLGLRLMLTPASDLDDPAHGVLPKLAPLAEKLRRLAVTTQYPLALVSIPGVLMSDHAWLEMAGASLWGAWTLLCSLSALLRFAALGLRGRPLEELCFDMGMLFLGIGGVWLIFWAYGVQPLGFPRAIVLFTAAHFHFAGMGVPFMFGLLGRWLRTLEVGASSKARASHKLWRVAAFCTLAGVPLVAVGITATKLGAPTWIQPCCAIPLIFSLFALDALLVWKVIRKSASKTARLFMSFAVLANVWAMSIAVLFVIGVGRQKAIVLIAEPIDQVYMADWHGFFNAIVFLGFGLLAWLLAVRLLNRAG